MKTLDNLKYCPKFILEAFIIIPVAIITNRASDGPYLSKSGIFELLFLYGFIWFVFRIVFASISWGVYSFRNLLSPLILMVLVFFINFSSILFLDKDLMKQTDKGMSQEELAKDCNDAKWLLQIDFETGFTTDHNTFYLVGNTESAKNQADKIINSYKADTKRKYILNYFSLYYMPRKFCQEKGYDLSWSDNN